MTLEPRRAALIALAIAAVAGLGTLRAGLLGDDHFQRALAVGRLSHFSHGPWDLYVFAPGDPAEMRATIEKGPYVWWANEHLKVRFFRPLSSLLLAADARIFGDTVWPAHLQAVLWYLLLVGGAIALYRRLLPGRAAAVAMILFAIDDGHWMPVTWLANRHALISAAPAAWGLWAWLRYRQERWRWGLPLSLALFVVALAGGEVALGVMAFLAAWELFAAPEPPVERLKALAPIVALGLAYVVAYRLLGFGTFGSPIYIDPAGQPVVYLLNAGPRLLALLGATTLNVASDAWMLKPLAPVVLPIIGAAGVAIFVWVWRALRTELEPDARRTAGALLAGTLLSLAPSLATFPTDRLLVVPSIGAAALLGLVVHAALSRGGRWARGLPALVVLGHVLVPAALWVVMPGGLAKVERSFEKAFLHANVPDARLDGRVMMLVAPDFISGMYPPIYRLEHGRPIPESWNVLSFAPKAHRVTRVDERTFELAVVEGTFLESVFERLFRDPERAPFEQGASIRLAAGSVTPLDFVEGRPSRVRVTLDDPPERYTLITWADGTLSPVALPPVGQSVVLERQKGPMEQELGL